MLIDLDKACDILWDIIEPYVNTYEDCEAIQIDFRKAMKTCNSDKNLQELTWQDIARIADIIGHTNRLTSGGEMRSQEEFYKEILEKYKEK